MNKKILLFALVFSMILANCVKRQKAIGGADDIYVFASDATREILGQAIDTTFSYGIRTPEFEKYYFTKWKPLDDFTQSVNYKNIILIADLNRKDVAYEIARGILPEKTFQMAEKDSVFMFSIPDNWADGQMFILIAGKDLKRIQRNILEQKGWLYGKFVKNFEEFQSKYQYARLEQTKLEKYFRQKYRWSMRIPHDYIIVKEISEKNFVWLGRGLPYRWISVSWEDGMYTEWLTANGLYDKRNQIGELYGGNVTEKRFLGYEYTKLGEYDALKMYGLWYQQEEAKGGPFATYAFYDKRTNRTFVIDMIIFSPGERVSVIFRNIEIMAKTFTTSFKK